MESAEGEMTQHTLKVAYGWTDRPGQKHLLTAPEATVVIQAKDNGGSHQAHRVGSGEK